MKKRFLISCAVLLAGVLLVAALFVGDRLLNGDKLELRSELPIEVNFSFMESQGDLHEFTLEEDREMIGEFISYLREFRYDDYFEMPFILGWSGDNFGLTYSDGEYWHIALVAEKGFQIQRGSGKDILYYAKDDEEFRSKSEYFLEKFSEGEKRENQEN